MSNLRTVVLERPEIDPPEIWKVRLPVLKKLHLRGTDRALALLEHLPERGLAVVGTRRPLSRSVDLVRKHLLRLSGSDLIIISGFARGIDAAAHQAALDAGLPTIAILGAGLEVCYPQENARLREAILANDGLLVSEFEPDATPESWHFLQRNRLIAAWSKAVWVAEAANPSGALNTACWMWKHVRRDLYATPCFPGDLHMTGNQRLLETEQAKPLWSLSDLGQTWLRLVDSDQRPRQCSLFEAAQGMSTDAAALTARVDEERARGKEKIKATQMDALLDWSIQQGWSPRRFFEALRNALDHGALFDENGLLLKKPTQSV